LPRLPHLADSGLMIAMRLPHGSSRPVAEAAISNYRGDLSAAII
jgi:hypothetical protein